MDIQTADQALITRFCDATDDGERQRCFSVLVERHGPMVMGVCRRIVGNGADCGPLHYRFAKARDILDGLSRVWPRSLNRRREFAFGSIGVAEFVDFLELH